MEKIEISNLSKTFTTGFKRTKKKAVDDVSFSINKGEIFGIIGVNGAGKSSILKMILGFIKPDSGMIFITDKAPTDPKSRSHIGYLPENPYFYDHLSAEELLKFGASASELDRNTAKKRMDALLMRVDLFHVKKQKLRSYSKGMTQRAGLCYALVHDPEIVILDEPMSGLDPIGRKMVIDLMLDLKKNGKTVLFCSHILSDVERICDRVAIMHQGRLKTILTRESILKQKKYIEIVVEKLTGALNNHLDKNNCSVINRADRITIECPEEIFESIFLFIRKENINVINIDSSANQMERIFLEVVDSENQDN